MKDIENNIGTISARIDQIASMTLAVSNAATYAPDNPEVYLEALHFLASAVMSLASDFKAIKTE